MDANEYLDFDAESQKMLLVYRNVTLSESQLQENRQMSTSLKSSFTYLKEATDTTGWDSDEYINLKLLIDQIKYAQSRIRDYQFEYDPQKLEENFSQTSIRSDKGSLIRLKVYRNPRKGNVDVKSENVRITQNIEARKEIIYYRLHFYYSDTHETAFILETINYQEFRNLNILLNYGDIDIYEPDYSYFLKNFTDSLRNERDPERLKFLYENIPESILVKMPEILDNKLVLDHINILTEFDDTGIFSGWKDGSSSIVNALKCLEHIFLINEFKKNPTLCNRIYYNLDGTSDLNGQIQSNKIIFATILMEYCMYSDNRPKADAATFKIGKKYMVGTKVTELGGEIGGLGKSDSSTFFLQQQEEYLLNEDDYEVDDLGVNTGAKRNTSKKIIKNLDEGKQYFPLEMVFFIDENQPPTIDEVTGKELKNRAIPVPAIYVKAFADTEKIQNIHQTIRIVADMIGIMAGTGTLLLTGNPYLALAAAADLSLMIPDLAIQTFRQEIIKLKGGEQLLKDWDLIYNTGGAIVAAPQLLTSFYRGVFIVLPQAAQNLQKGLQAMAISVFLDLNVGRFQRSELRFLQKSEWIIPSCSKFSSATCASLENIGAAFIEVVNNTTKASKQEYMLIYRGLPVAKGNKNIKPYAELMQKVKDVSYSEEKLVNVLEEAFDDTWMFLDKEPASGMKYSTTNLEDMYSIGSKKEFEKGVKYLNEKEREVYEIFVQHDKIVDSKGNLIDTSGSISILEDGTPDITDYAIFVMSEKGQLYLSKSRKVGEFHHSSFLEGKPVAAAGEMIIKKGVIIEINNASGHYKPSLDFVKKNVVKELDNRHYFIGLNSERNIKFISEF